MTEPWQSDPPEFRLSTPFWIGLILFAVGSGPLLVIILLAALGVTNDPNPNPVGFGMLAVCTFWPSVVLIAVGLLASLFRYRAAKKRFNNHDT